MLGATFHATGTLTCVVHVRRNALVVVVDGLFKAIEVSR